MEQLDQRVCMHLFAKALFGFFFFRVSSVLHLLYIISPQTHENYENYFLIQPFEG